MPRLEKSCAVFRAPTSPKQSTRKISTFPCTGSASRGMHRFIWDLTYPAPDVLTRDYPISAIYHDTPLYPLGAAVLPGQYKVELSVGGKSYTQTLNMKMDP